MLGPFGSYAAPLLDRLIFWVATVLLGTGLSVLAALLLPARWRQASLPLYVLGATLVLSPVQTLGVRLLLPLVAPPDQIAHFSFWTSLPQAMLLMALGTAASILFVRLRRPLVPESATAITPPPPLPPATAPFFDRLPPALGRDLLYLEMEDHYLRVHTTTGNSLILLRLRDAVAELRSVPGAQVHKSWWVARAAVTSAERGKSGWELVLTDGRRVPVGRSFRAALAADGWLPQGRTGEDNSHASGVAEPAKNPSAPSENARPLS